MFKFRLIGRTTVFHATKTYLAAGFIPSVKGITADGKLETCARMNDVIWISG